jgi:hypothetical protein
MEHFTFNAIKTRLAKMHHAAGKIENDVTGASSLTSDRASQLA